MKKNSFEKKMDELEKYEKLLDKTIQNLKHVYRMKCNKVNPIMAVLGIILVGLGGVLIAYSSSTDIIKNGTVSFWGAFLIFIGLSVAFIGYIIAHKGLKGTWL